MPIQQSFKMLSEINPFYDPYPLPYLPFLQSHKNISLENDRHINQNDELFEEVVTFISHLDLHTQTENPIVTLGICLPIWFFFTIMAIFIQILTLDMLKQENSVNNKLMVTQAKLHIVFWPTIMIMIELTDNIYPLAAYTSPYFCTVMCLFITFCSFCIILYSFYAALLRYVFCTYSEWVKKFGKEKLIRIVYWVFYIHCFAWAIGAKLLRISLEAAPMINSCYGWADRVYLLELDDGANMMKRHFCGFDSPSIGMKFL